MWTDAFFFLFLFLVISLVFAVWFRFHLLEIKQMEQRLSALRKELMCMQNRTLEKEDQLELESTLKKIHQSSKNVLSTEIYRLFFEMMKNKNES